MTTLYEKWHRLELAAAGRDDAKLDVLNCLAGAGVGDPRFERTAARLRRAEQELTVARSEYLEQESAESALERHDTATPFEQFEQGRVVVTRVKVERERADGQKEADEKNG